MTITPPPLPPPLPTAPPPLTITLPTSQSSPQPKSTTPKQTPPTSPPIIQSPPATPLVIATNNGQSPESTKEVTNEPELLDTGTSIKGDYVKITGGNYKGVIARLQSKKGSDEKTWNMNVRSDQYGNKLADDDRGFYKLDDNFSTKLWEKLESIPDWMPEQEIEIEDGKKKLLENDDKGVSTRRSRIKPPAAIVEEKVVAPVTQLPEEIQEEKIDCSLKANFHMMNPHILNRNQGITAQELHP
jgi:hypothetical protein